MKERNPKGQFTGTARLSGLEIGLMGLLGSVLGIVAIFVLLWLVH